MNHNLLKIIYLLFFSLISSSVIHPYDYLAPNSKYEEDLPYELNLGSFPVERPAHYQYDQAFWTLIEQNNPGTLFKVMRVLALYFDETYQNLEGSPATRDPLVKGIDYDEIVGRSVWIHLDVPIFFEGIQFKTLILKGAPFKKSEKDELFSSYGEVPEGYQGGVLGFDADGSIKIVQTGKERKNAYRYDDAKNEYEMGRHAFFSQRGHIVSMLPIMKLRYDHEAGPNGPIGVTVMASPEVIQLYGNLTNRVGHVLSMNFHRYKEEKHKTKKEMSQFWRLVFYNMGAVFRAFHDAGYVHGNPHIGNFYILSEDMIRLVDLGEMQLKSDLTEIQSLGNQLRDIYFSMMEIFKTIQRMQRTEPFLAELNTMAVFYFFYGYLGEHASIYLTNPRMLNYDIVQFFHEVEKMGFVTKDVRNVQGRIAQIISRINRDSMNQSIMPPAMAMQLRQSIIRMIFEDMDLQARTNQDIAASA